MKKILFAALGIILFSVIAVAQDTKTERTPRTFVVITAGPAFPIGDFASTDYNKEEAGWARDGYTIEAKIGHHLDNIFGLAGGVAYGHFAVDNAFMGYDGNNSNTSMKPWDFWTVLVGPMVTGKLSQRTTIDFSVLSGVGFAKSPKVIYQNEVVRTADNTTTVPMKFAADFRFRFNEKGYVFAGANYQYMRPKFTVDTQGYYGEDGSSTYTYTFKQKMSIIGLNVGVGIGF